MDCGAPDRIVGSMDDDLPHILVVDDDRRLRDLLRKYLSDNGFRVTTADGAQEARRNLAAFAFDLVVLDVMMPGESGLELAESLRDTSLVPILMLSAMGETEDRIVGLERGADDYLAKPFEPRELLLRIQTVLRRVPRESEETQEIQLGPFRFDPGRGELFRDETRIRLTESEARLLAALARRPGNTVSREDLTREIGLDGGTRAVDVQMTRLRRKIERDPRDPRYLQTVRGKGYQLTPD
jgi:two-component system phosphate regulon response regulator OmpR